MTNTNRRRAEQLGMPYGTACNRLRKEILFSLVQRVGEDVCYRCGERIERVEEFSVEHKKQWLDVSEELFWDLENIAFSHLSCNTKAKRSSPQRIAPHGKEWCSSCQNFVPEERFGPAPPRKNTKQNKRKLRGYCNECRKARGWGHKKVGMSNEIED